MPFTNPYLNLAAEEYFLKHKQGEYFLLWQNEPCIVVGRNQNTRKEINYEYVTQHEIPVVRRLTGGGTVFHDLGNLNFTLIQEGVEQDFGNYKVFATPVIETLGEMGVTATLSGRNDLLVGDRKFCGQAQTLWHGRLMHHGCMLFCANVEALTKALTVNPLKIQSKGIDSVRSRVVNLADCFSEPRTLEEFTQKLQQRMLEKQGNQPYTLTIDDLEAIEFLKAKKYQTHDWNYGFSKDYAFQKETRFAGGIVSVSMNIHENAIAELSLRGDFFGIKEPEELERCLTGIAYEEKAVLKALESINLQEYMAGISPEELCNAMF